MENINEQDPETHTVMIESDQYLPSELRIKRRDKVIWKNNDQRIHTINWAEAEFENTQLNLLETHEQVFDHKGTHYYFCVYHDSERGVIYVE